MTSQSPKTENKTNMPDRELTDESFELEAKDIFHYTGGDYKPWWCACDNGNLQKIRGYNSMEPSQLLYELEEIAPDDGRIVKLDKEGNPQDYLIEIKVRVTKLRRAT